jgi:ATP-binding cassette subfamily F protein 3
MITISNLSKELPGRTLLKDVSLSIYRNERVGLTGPNGAGKSSLFSLILGEMQPSGGTIQVQKNLNIGFLPQEARFSSERTVIDELTSGDQRMAGLVKEQRELEDAGKAASMRYGDVLHELEVLGIYDLQHKAEKILSGLGFKTEEFDKPIVNLSGGWQMRTLLAKILTYHYDVILLDEPTNYLDLDATLWLKGFLAGYPGTFVIISHDKLFLNDVTNYTIVLENGVMTKVKGNYETYEEAKDIEYRTLEKKQKVIEKKRDQLQRFTERFHAQPNRASAVRNKRKMIERLEEIDLPQERRSIADFQFPETKRSGHVVINLEQASKSYGDKVIYQNLDFELLRGQKLCLVGPNGAGKSTLLKMLAGVVETDSGGRRLGMNVDLGYFSQTRLDVLNEERTVFDETASSVPGNIPALTVRSLLGIFNFHGDDVFKQVKVLSGGEKSRLILAKLLINPPNFILLDEPTTHLDIHGVEALTRCFKAYEGTLCFISHDLFFVKEIANHIVEVNQGVLKQYPGGLDYYLDKKAGRDSSPRGDKERNAVGHSKNKTDAQLDREEKKRIETELHRQHKKALNRFAEIKDEIKNLEREKKELETESYVKSRTMAQSFSGRDQSQIKEMGQRLKWIQGRLRDIESTIKNLNAEKKKINR